MTPYFVLFSLLWITAFADAFMGMRRAYWLAAVGVLVFLCLRFDTGYDWPEYKLLYEATPQLPQLLADGVFYFSKLVQKEPLFLLLISVLKLLSEDYQLLIALVSVVEVACFMLFLQRVTENRGMVFAASLSWLLFTLYMSTLRQGLAVSFFFLFFLAYFDKRWMAATLWAALAVLFQFSAAGYLVLFFLAFLIPTNALIKLLFVLLWLLSVSGLDMTRSFLMLFSGTGFSFIDAKISYYLYDLGQEVHFFDRVYAMVYPIAFYLMVFHFDKGDERQQTPMMRAMRGLSWLYLFVMVLFIEFPLIRNRLQYLVLPMHYLLLTRIFINKGQLTKSLFFGGMLIVHLLYFSLFLGKASSLPFVPYQSYWSYVQTGDEGDGEERYEAISP